MSKIADPRDVLLKPVISEKSYRLVDDGKYTFLVAPDANKTQIRQAVEQIFHVKVTGVNTINRPGKRRRTRFGWGRRQASGSTSSAGRSARDRQHSDRSLSRHGHPQVQADHPGQAGRERPGLRRDHPRRA
jgi:large subunit ribosomal protein L23